MDGVDKVDLLNIHAAGLMFGLSTLIDHLRELSPEERVKMKVCGAAAAETALSGDNEAVFEAVWPVLFERAVQPRDV